MKADQKGFSVAVLVIALSIGLIVCAGVYVFNRQSTKEPEDIVTSQVQSSTQAQSDNCSAAKEDQKSWTLAVSHKKSFSMCVPGGWTLLSDIQSERFVVLPPFTAVEGAQAIIKNQTFEGKDGTNDQLLVFVADRTYQGWTSDDAEKSDFTLYDGTKGVRYYTKHTATTQGLGPIEGEEDYEYLFDKGGKFIHAVYTIRPGTEKHLEIIESVLRTLKIN